MARRMIQPSESYCSTLKIRWISSKYVNFTKNKIYTAEPMDKSITMPTKYHNFQITDDEGDFVSLDKRDIGKKYIIVKE